MAGASFDISGLDELVRETTDDIQGALKGAMEDVVLGKNLPALRADIAQGGFHNASKLAGTWRGRVYSDGNGFVWNRAGDIIETFSLGLTIRAPGGRYLAIPFGRAVAIVRSLNRAENRSRDGGGKFVDEAAKVNRVAGALGVHRLVFERAKGGNAVLVAPNRVRNEPGEVLFLLLKSVTLRQRIKGLALLQQLQESFADDFQAALDERLSV